ncbi:MAG TPA: hypothetical protein VL027_04510 [Spongiibacteraceae bacterium]|jgi:cytochrome c556|nr:hypothetical protein [Spongiibacteraceae bacterium]HUH37191.1 hypothetical protein [Spongiibacteraceae bacterium]
MLIRSIGLSTILSLTLAGAVQAQGFLGMNDAQMQQMMQQANKMQQCVQNIDQKEVEALTTRAQAIEKDVKGLCKAGKRDAAQRQAIAYGQEIANAKVMKELQRCGEMFKQFMPDIALADYANTDENDPDYQHICDAL